jgi:putative methyltransferase (TIGR04325 family)
MLGRILSLLPLKTLRGYENPELVETIFRKTVAYEPVEPWPEMEGVTSVLDFGGACGRHYKEARRQSPLIRWAVVDTPAMVARARELETDHLKFFTEISSAADWLGTIEVVHSNGAIQYAPSPLAVVRELCSLRAGRMMWYRLLFGDGPGQIQISRLADNGPGKTKTALKKVAYQQTPIAENDFIAAHVEYSIEARGPDWFKFAR